jgi:hypothetical protein
MKIHLITIKISIKWVTATFIKSKCSMGHNFCLKWKINNRKLKRYKNSIHQTMLKQNHILSSMNYFDSDMSNSTNTGVYFDGKDSNLYLRLWAATKIFQVTDVRSIMMRKKPIKIYMSSI